MKKSTKVQIRCLYIIAIIILLLPLLFVGTVVVGDIFHSFDNYSFTDSRDIVIQLPNEYKYYCVSEHICKISLDNYSSDAAILPAKIIELAYNDRYVVAKQYGLELSAPDYIFSRPNKNEVYYWILDTEERTRFGPYDNLSEFEQKKTELNISSLKLKGVGSYK